MLSELIDRVFLNWCWMRTHEMQRNIFFSSWPCAFFYQIAVIMYFEQVLLVSTLNQMICSWHWITVHSHIFASIVELFFLCCIAFNSNLKVMKMWHYLLKADVIFLVLRHHPLEVSWMHLSLLFTTPARVHCCCPWTKGIARKLFAHVYLIATHGGTPPKC